MSDLMLGMSVDLIRRRIVYFKEAYDQHHADYEKSGRSDPSMLIAAEANYFFIVDHQARIFMRERGMNYDDCLFQPLTGQISGFSDKALDQEFEIRRHKY